MHLVSVMKEYDYEYYVACEMLCKTCCPKLYWQSRKSVSDYCLLVLYLVSRWMSVVYNHIMKLSSIEISRKRKKNAY